MKTFSLFMLKAKNNKYIALTLGSLFSFERRCSMSSGNFSSNNSFLDSDCLGNSFNIHFSEDLCVFNFFKKSSQYYVLFENKDLLFFISLINFCSSNFEKSGLITFGFNFGTLSKNLFSAISHSKF